jgi:hypothetical protein
MSATHFIHIGRNKCASTTLQYFFLQNAAMLAAHGIDYFSDSQLAKSFARPGEVRSDAERAERVRTHPERSTLFSDEWLMALAPEDTRAQFEKLGGAPCRVLAYIRDYGSWMRSNYAHAAVAGLSWSNFDDYYAATLPIASALPALSVWGERVGWAHMYVRPLDALYEGDVIRDCGRALGLPDDAVAGAARQNMNEAPHWIGVEFLRMARASDPEMDRALFRRRVRRPLLSILDESVAKHADAIPRALYLSSDQARAMTDLYNADADTLSAVIDAPIPRVGAPPPGRDFLPTLEAAPRAVLDEIARRVSAPDFSANHPAAKAAAETVLASVR